MSPPRAFLRARCWRRQRTRYDRFETEAFIKVRRTCTYIYIWTSIRAIILWSLKALGQSVLALLSGNSFYSSGHRDLDLWSTDPKINRVLLLNKGYHPEGSGSKGTRVIERKEVWQTDRRINWQGNYVTYWAHVTLTFDLLTQKLIGFFYSIRAIILWSFKALAQRVLELLSGKWFSLFGSLWPWPLTYWPQNQ